MKKSIFTILLMFVMIFATGCAKEKMSYTIDIDKDGNINVYEILSINKNQAKESAEKYGITDAVLEKAGYNSIDDLLTLVIKKTHAKEDMNTKNYSEGDYVGIAQEKLNLNSNTFTTKYLMTGLTSFKQTPVLVDNGLFVDNYKIRLRYNFQKAYHETCRKNSEFRTSYDKNYTASAENFKYNFKDNGNGTYTVKIKGQDNEGEYTKSSDQVPNPEITLTIKTPAKAKKHNATRVINKTEYQWDLFSLDKNVEIYLEFDKLNSNNIPPLLIIISFFAILGTLGHIFLKSKGDISL